MYFPDFDTEWDDNLPTVLQVLEGIEVEDMPDIYVEREPSIYTPTISDMDRTDRLVGLKLILGSAENPTAEILSAEQEPSGVRVIEYKPLSTSTIPHSTAKYPGAPPCPPSSFTPTATTTTSFKPGIGSAARIDPGSTTDTKLVEFSGEVQVEAATQDTAVFTRMLKPPRNVGTAIDKHPRCTNKELIKSFDGSDGYKRVTVKKAGVESKTGVAKCTDKAPEVAEVTDSAEDGITLGVRMFSL